MQWRCSLKGNMGSAKTSPDSKGMSRFKTLYGADDEVLSFSVTHTVTLYQNTIPE